MAGLRVSGPSAMLGTKEGEARPQSALARGQADGGRPDVNDTTSPLRRRQADPWDDPEEWCVRRFGRERFNLIRGRLAEAEALRQAQRDGRDLRRVLAGREAGDPSLRRLAALAAKVRGEVDRLHLGSDAHRLIYRGKDEALGAGLRSLLDAVGQVHAEVKASAAKVARLAKQIEAAHTGAARLVKRGWPKGMRPGAIDLAARVLVSVEKQAQGEKRTGRRNGTTPLKRAGPSSQRFTARAAALISCACGLEGPPERSGWRGRTERSIREGTWKRRLLRARQV